MSSLSDDLRCIARAISASVETCQQIEDAASTLEALQAQVDALTSRVAELEAEKLASLEAGKREWDYYQATTCPCQAAERYVPSCPKHGLSLQRDTD